MRSHIFRQRLAHSFGGWMVIVLTTGHGASCAGFAMASFTPRSSVRVERTSASPVASETPIDVLA
jgi:hypothetical protein